MKYIFILIVGLLILPMVWMIALSFQQVDEVIRMPPRLISKNPTLINYRMIFDHTPMLRWTLNSMIIVAGSLSLMLVTSVMAGWGFAGYRFRGRRALAWTLILFMLVPQYALMISRFVLIVRIGLYNTWWPLFMLAAFQPAAIIVFAKFFGKIPESMADCARLDGARERQILFRVLLPQAMPLVGFYTIAFFVGLFAEMWWPMLLLQDSDKFPLFWGLIKFSREFVFYNFAGAEDFDAKRYTVGVAQATSSLLLIPPVVVFILCRKTFRKKFMQGGIKE